MKDTDYKEGYFFIKGYNDYDEEITLSGLTVNVAPSDSVSYDSSTGKVTVKYDDPGFAVVKNVSVFAQYSGTNGEILTCQKTLEVTTIGYPSEIEFGEVKKDGTPREDGRITIAELGSNKYYVELDTVKDQYGNDLSAEDLNYLVTEKKLVTVIPISGSPIYFGTNASPFSTKDGKVVIFLTPGNNMPGTNALMITGAGGTFSKDITIDDNPFINVLNVEVPDLYEGEWSSDFTFTAVDQYGGDLDLYQFAPSENLYNGLNAGGVLNFRDQNNQVGKWTQITAENNGTWKVTKDTVKKTFKVTYLPAGKAKSMATFTVQPAGLLGTTVKTATIGGKGSSATIVEQGSAATVNAGKDSNISSAVKFKDANGKVMDRVKDAARYPMFLGGAAAQAIETDATLDLTKDVNYYYYWTVSNARLAENTTNGGKKAGTKAGAGVFFDDDSKIYGDNAAHEAYTRADGTPVAARATDIAQGRLAVSAVDPTANFYITLLVSTADDGTANYRILDTKAYRFIYVPASATEVTYTVKDTSKALLYAHPDSKDGEDITLIATNKAGESWEVPAGSLTPDAPFTSTGNRVEGKIPAKIGDGKLSVKVYAPDGTAVDTVQIAYSDDDRVPTTAKTELTTPAGLPDGTRPEGADWKPGHELDFETGVAPATNAAASMDDGKFTLTNATCWGDTFTAWIEDQYGVQMTDSIVKLDGKYLTDGVGVTHGKLGNFVLTNGSQKVDVRVLAAYGVINTTKAVYSTSATVETDTELFAALAAGTTTITLAKNIEVDDDMTIPNGTELVIPTGKKLTTNGNVTVGSGAKTDTTKRQDTDAVVTVAGIWEHNGVDITDGKKTITNNGSIIVTGTANFTNTDITNNGYFNEGTASLHFFGTSSIDGTGTFSGKMAVEPECVLTFNSTPTIIGTLNVDGVVDFNSKAVNFANASDGTATTVDISGGAVLGATAVKLAKDVVVTTSAGDVTAGAAVADGGALATDAADKDTGLIDRFVTAWKLLPPAATIPTNEDWAGVANKLKSIDDVLTLAESVEDQTDANTKLAYQVGIVKALNNENLSDWADIYYVATSEGESDGYLQNMVSEWKDAVETYETSFITALDAAITNYLSDPSDTAASALKTAYDTLTAEGAEPDTVETYEELLLAYDWLGAKGFDELLGTNDVVDRAQDLLNLDSIVVSSSAVDTQNNAKWNVAFTNTTNITASTPVVAAAGEGKITATCSDNTLTVTASAAANNVGVSVSFEGTYYTKTFNFTATATKDGDPALTSLDAGAVTVAALNAG